MSLIFLGQAGIYATLAANLGLPLGWLACCHSGELNSIPRASNKYLIMFLLQTYVILVYILSCKLIHKDQIITRNSLLRSQFKIHNALKTEQQQQQQNLTDLSFYSVFQTFSQIIMSSCVKSIQKEISALPTIAENW